MSVVREMNNEVNNEVKEGAIFKIDDIKARKSSVFDEAIENFLQQYEETGSNVYAITEAKASTASGMVQRMNTAYKEELEDLKVEVRCITVTKSHTQLKGYKKAIILNPTSDALPTETQAG